jgi:hypothetical protein
MTAVTPVAGDSWKSPCGIAELPCRASARRPTSLQQLLAASPGRGCCRRRGAGRQRGRHQRHPVWVLRHQPVRVAVGLQAGWIEATICDRAVPASHTAPVTTPCRAWAVADRAVGRRVVLCEGPLRDAGDAPPEHPSADWHLSKRQADRCGHHDRLSRLRRASPDSWNRRLNGKVDATPARQSASVTLGSYLRHSSGKAARHPPRSLQRSHDERSASGGHL